MIHGLKASLQNLLLLVVASALGLAVLEVSLRATHAFGARISWSEPDDTLGYRYAPGAHYWDRGGAQGFFNSFGWRDADRSLEKAPGTTRVAVVGDSFVEAFQVEEQDTFQRLARDLLASRGHRVEILSFARSGFTTTEELIVIRDEVFKFHPDLVVLFFYPGNDLRDVRRELASGDPRPFFVEDGQGGLLLDTSFRYTKDYRARRFINPLKRHSALVSLILERLKAAREGGGGGAPSREHAREGWLSLGSSSPDPRYERAFALTQRLILEAARLVGPRRFLVATIETTGWKPEDEAELRAEDPSFDPFHFEKAMERLSRGHGFHHLGLATSFRRDWERNRQPRRVGHWNRGGHAVVAQALADRLDPLLRSLPPVP